MSFANLVIACLVSPVGPLLWEDDISRGTLAFNALCVMLVLGTLDWWTGRRGAK